MNLTLERELQFSINSEKTQAENLCATMNIFCEFNQLVSIITSSETIKEVKQRLQSINFVHFIFGYGIDHLWVHQKFEEDINYNRIICVKL